MGCDELRVIQAREIADAIERLCIEANCCLPEENLKMIEAFAATEDSEVGRQVLEMILENHRLAAREMRPACQDTGLAVVFLEIGQGVHVAGGSLEEAVNEGVRRGYERGYLRKSVVSDPLFERKNTGDNTPAIVHTTIVPGRQVRITLAPKGGGAENMSAVAMMIPAAGVEGVKSFVIEQVRKAGPNPCPPVVVGVGGRRQLRDGSSAGEAGAGAAARGAGIRTRRMRPWKKSCWRRLMGWGSVRRG